MARLSARSGKVDTGFPIRTCANAKSACSGKVGTGFPIRTCANAKKVEHFQDEGNPSGFRRACDPSRILKRQAPINKQMFRSGTFIASSESLCHVSNQTVGEALLVGGLEFPSLGGVTQCDRTFFALRRRLRSSCLRYRSMFRRRTVEVRAAPAPQRRHRRRTSARLHRRRVRRPHPRPVSRHQLRHRISRRRRSA